ncbi:MAG TPA: 50S ribosomal protein L32 [Gemmatimonadales bacterium]|jgi:large subunit ribosomal protein L32|nr:50S ribosomal protein L32 [Gemmatimonadales bacterium]
MAVPKRRTSKSRKRKRRTHHKAAPVALQACPRCGDPKRPHRVCPTCGYYAGKKQVEVTEDV